jgi:predicted DNA-binding ribbon-helix-helix protein
MSISEPGTGAATAKRPAEPASTLVNRNVTVSGHRTSIRLEPEMWQALQEICVRENVSLHAVVSSIAEEREASSLTSSIRAYLLRYFRLAATEDGHRRAGHGAAINRYSA